MLKRIGIALMLALTLVVGQTSSVAAYGYTGGFFYNSAIADSDGNGIADLHVCFTANTPVFTNRATIMEGLREWGVGGNVAGNADGGVHKVELISKGQNCDPNIVNVYVLWGDILGQPAGCEAGVNYIAATGNPGTGYFGIGIVFNQHCLWHWGLGTPVPNGFYDAFSTATHEMGHAYGLGHTGSDWLPYDGNLMNESFTDTCGRPNGVRAGISNNDAAGVRARYGGIPDTNVGFPQPSQCWE